MSTHSPATAALAKMILVEQSRALGLAMDQTEYESSLEYRICLEFSGMSESRLRELWCDGVLLETFLLDDPRPRVLGAAWICKGQNQEEWRLELLLPSTLNSRHEIEWEQLLPPENVTQWLALDRQEKFLQIEPAAAVPDLQKKPHLATH